MNRSDSMCNLSDEPVEDFVNVLSTNAGTISTETIVKHNANKSKKIDSKSNKCSMCNKKLITSRCKCDIIFCMKHLNTHPCTFDYHKEHANKLKKANPIVITDKLTRI
jgi:hypothetical protein